jgi:hypothetical protein
LIHNNNNSNDENINIIENRNKLNNLNNIVNNKIKDNNSDGIIFKRRLYKKSKDRIKYFKNILRRKNISINKKTEINIDIYDLRKKLLNIYKKKLTKERSKDKKLNIQSSKYLKYFEDLERKSTMPVNESKLRMIIKKGVERQNKKLKKKQRIKKFGMSKYSLEQYKRRNFYIGGKKKVAPKIRKEKLMNFYLYSQIQKKQTNPYINTISNINKSDKDINKEKKKKEKRFLNKNNIKENKKYSELKIIKDLNYFNKNKKEELNIFNNNEIKLKLDLELELELKNNLDINKMLKVNNIKDVTENKSLLKEEQSLNNIDLVALEKINKLSTLLNKFYLINFKEDKYKNLGINKKLLMSQLNKVSKEKNVNNNNIININKDTIITNTYKELNNSKRKYLNILRRINKYID